MDTESKPESMRERMRRQHAERVAAERSALAAKMPKRHRRRNLYASREEQHARYIDCGPGAWDDR